MRATCAPSPAQCDGFTTHLFDYDSGAGQPDNRPHLTGVTSRIETGESYDFVFQNVASLTAPFAGSLNYGPSRYLQSITQRVTTLAHTFTYQTGGELTQARMPYGATLGWTYRSFTYQGSRTFREVASRTQRPLPGAPLLTYTLTHDDAGDAARSLHSRTTLTDASGTADQNWLFQTLTSVFDVALVKTIERRVVPGGAVRSKEEFTWAQTPLGNAYIGTSLSTLDPGTAFASQRKTEQTIGNNGNVTQSRLYNLNSLSTPARTYNYTYLATPDYLNRYIRNRLLTASVTAGGVTTPLTSNTYDQYGAMSGCPTRGGLVDRAGIREQDSAGYGATFLQRGNVAMAQVPGRTACFTHDIAGQTAKGSDVDGHSRDTGYSSGNNYAAPMSITPNGVAALTSSYQYSPFLGLTGITGPNTETLALSYDAQARPQSQTSPHGAQTTFAYLDSVRQRTATVNGRVSRTTYDGFGRVVKQERLDSGGTVRSIVDTEYTPCACSPLGKVKRVSMPYAPGGTVYWTTYSYDPLGRTLTTTLPNNTGTVTYLYEGNTVKITNPSGKWKKYATDAFGNLLQVNEPHPSSGSDQVTTYTYSTFNQLRTAVMTRGSTTQTRTFVYDPVTLRLTSVTLPESGTKTFVYNNDGTLLRQTDAKNQKMEYVYDTLGRLTMVKRFGPGSMVEDVCQRVTYTWDTNSLGGGFWSTYTQGRMTTAQYGGAACASKSFTEMYSYTRAGLANAKRLTHIRGSLSAFLESTMTYDGEGRMASMRYPVAYQLADPNTLVPASEFFYTYDNLGRPAGLNEQRDRLVNIVKDVTYGPADENKTITYLNQLGAGAGQDTYRVETRQYNARLQTTRITVPGVTDLEYRYSPTQNDGQSTSRKEYVSGEDVTYTYDNLQRLIGAITTHTGGTAPQWGQSFTYDGFGNMTDQAVTNGTAPSFSITINPANNRMAAFTYDANGNQTSAPLGAGSMTLGYDVENRLVTSSAGEEYGYDSANKRVWRKKAGGVEEVYFYGAGGMRMGTYQVSAGGTLKLLEVHRNIYFAGRAVRMEGQAFVADKLGSDVTGGRRYYPYGQEQSVTPGDETKFGTYHRDSTTNLDYADQRYFGSQYGRFYDGGPLRGQRGLASAAELESIFLCRRQPCESDRSEGP